MADKNMKAQISVEFEEATSRQSLNSGETINTLWSKVKRWLSDLKAVAFSGSYNDLSDTPTTATKDTDGLMSAEDKNKLDSADDTYALKSKYGDTTIDVGRKAETDVGEYSTAEGHDTTASGGASHAEGLNTIASGAHSHAEGVETIASGSRSHAEGIWTIASGGSNHAEGRETTANGNNSCHAEGQLTTASGIATHAEGSSSNKVTDLITDFSWNGTTNDDIINAWNTQKFSVAHGRSSHVEGSDNLSLGHSSHAEGLDTVAIGDQSHTSGYYTKALHDNEAAYGKYNQSNDNTLFSIGDGTADDARHNAFEITKTGGRLHDKDIATTDLIPTTLPANGGNADTVNSLRAYAEPYQDIFSASLTAEHPCWNKKCVVLGQSLDPNAGDYVDNAPESGILIWYEVETIGSGNRAYQIAHGCYTHQRKSFIRYMHDGGWSDWKEISTTQIYSSTVTATTDENGSAPLWVLSNGIIPISAYSTLNKDIICTPFVASNEMWDLAVDSAWTHDKLASTACTFIVNYIRN